MSETVTALHAQRWAKRALLIDMFAIALLPILGLSLIRESFDLALVYGEGSSGAIINRLLLTTAIGMLDIAWIGYRLVSMTARIRDVVR